MARALERKNAEAGIIAPLTVLLGKLRRSPVAEQFPAARMCSRLASCRNAICGTAPCGGTGLLACDRRRLRRPVQVVTVPTINLCPGSSGFVLQAFDPIQIRDRPTPSKDGWLVRPCGTA